MYPRYKIIERDEEKDSVTQGRAQNICRVGRKLGEFPFPSAEGIIYIKQEQEPPYSEGS